MRIIVLGETIVLPPGDYDNKALLPVEELRKKSEHIRRRQERLRRLSKKPAFRGGKVANNEYDPNTYYNYVNGKRESRFIFSLVLFIHIFLEEEEDIS